ncbi:MAG: putative addiction module component (TIGR02574 family) [Gammaproteobacteria bacterium]|jgi:putative addiction module component (TIGR02574 family)
MKPAIAETLELPISERIEIVAEIWESIVKNPDEIEIGKSTRELLRKRLSEHKGDPEDGSPWEEVKGKILNK